MLIGQAGQAGHCMINATCLTSEIGIVRDRDDPGMVSSLPVQLDVILTVACEDGTAEERRESQLVCIRDGLVCLSSFKSREDVVAELAQPLHNGEGKILVRVKPGHDALGFLVETNGFVDFRRVAGIIVPGRIEVVLRQPLDYLQ